MTHPKANEFHQQYMAHEDDNNISLVDLWLSIRRYKKRFMFVFSFVLLAGLLFLYFSYTEIYSLVTTIQIGTLEQDNAILPIESPESLLSKVSNSIIPSYTNMWSQKNDSVGIIETNSSSPKNSNIILIKNKTSKEDVGLLSDFQKGLVKIVIGDHKSMINSSKSKVKSELRGAQVELDNLKNPALLEHKLKAAKIELDNELIELKKLENERFQEVKKAEFQAEILQVKHEKKQLDDLEKVRLEQYNRIEETKKILLEKINDLKAQIADDSKRLRAAATVATEENAMARLLIANEIQQNRNQLASFEERYHVQLENEKTGLMHQIEGTRLEKIELLNKIDLLTDKYKVLLEDDRILLDRQKLKVDEIKVKLEKIKLEHEQSIAMQEQKVYELKTRLDNFNETRAVSTAVQSLKPEGVSRFKLGFIAILVAGLAAVVAVFLAIFRDKVKERLEEEAVA
jgi:hypothetical protein